MKKQKIQYNIENFHMENFEYEKNSITSHIIKKYVILMKILKLDFSIFFKIQNFILKILDLLQRVCGF